MMSPYLVVAPSDKRGRGVFTSKSIPSNTIIEISPVLVISASERAIIEKTKLFSYIFEWGKTRKQGCFALGYVSLYNHAYQSNCEYEMDFEHRLVTIRTVRKIKKGEELFINYNAHPNDNTAVWFDAT
ncbi:SET domain-containing protein [Panacibacter ginsenosidivorans]|uniref:SET domain-containing protein n=1 Tax=Panacibacter ginsenosidivorans TaxID=1813871 RepID=A0A5B8V6J7_9BACT|nr:SET domain-containing protein [Panacibacter ginsenosidivorans]QEC67034.1 SET domain-containing protein [Panacibacter ginsenosidivorans]